MLCSHCLYAYFIRAVIRATQCCLTVPPCYLFAVLLLYFEQINDDDEDDDDDDDCYDDDEKWDGSGRSVEI